MTVCSLTSGAPVMMARVVSSPTHSHVCLLSLERWSRYSTFQSELLCSSVVLSRRPHLLLSSFQAFVTFKKVASSVLVMDVVLVIAFDGSSTSPVHVVVCLPS